MPAYRVREHNNTSQDRKKKSKKEERSEEKLKKKEKMEKRKQSKTKRQVGVVKNVMKEDRKGKPAKARICVVFCLHIKPFVLRNISTHSRVRAYSSS